LVVLHHLASRHTSYTHFPFFTESFDLKKKQSRVVGFQSVYFKDCLALLYYLEETMQVTRCALLSVLALTSSTVSAFLAPQVRSVIASSASLGKGSTIELAASALIVQNKGGGHGELGYQLAKTLLKDYSDKIDSVTILQDEACNDSKEPFKSYATDLPTVKVIKTPLADESMTKATLQSMLGAGTTFDYVWDNASKNSEGSGKAIIDCAQDWGTVQLFCYVSSAGIYKPSPDGPFPMPEDSTPIKTTAGQHLFDTYAVKQGLPLVSFRPQYIYGPKSNKFDYIDYYFDRLVRDLPIPIPGDGTQMVSLTCSEDVATLLASPLQNPQAAI
jgi:hypothetical protein